MMLSVCLYFELENAACVNLTHDLKRDNQMVS